MWQQAVGNKLISIEDTLVTVIYPGRTNGTNGPDFRDAVIVNESCLMKGDVEIHVKSSDWYSHGHNTDADYNNVMLHVVMWQDCNSATLLQNGKTVPIICLAIALQQQAYLLSDHLPCFQILNQIDMQSLKNLLSNAGEARFRKKAIYFGTELKQKEEGHVLLRGIMGALGYVKNKKPFENLADRVPLNSIESQKGVALRQALLLGTAGLLPSQRWQGEFTMKREVQELEELWRSTGGKVSTMKERDWTLSHIYPNNSPVRRIVALSYLLERYSGKKLLARILQLVKEAPRTDGHYVLQKGLTVTGDGYWRHHFDFDIRNKTRKSALLGHNKAGEITVNVILPFAYAWGELNADAKITENAFDLYRNYPRLSDNHLTDHMKKQVGLEGSASLTACHQQGLIHIFRNYCCEGKCRQCPLVV
jgi:hypothetical protein